MPTKTPKTTDESAKTPRPKKGASESSSDASNSKDSNAKANGAKANGAKTTNAKVSNANASYMNAGDLEHFQDLLLAERARLEEEREQIRSRSGSVDGALPEEGEGGDEDTADLASAMMDKEMDLSVEDEIDDLLTQVSHALRKIEDGTYGICDMSGERIPKGRLELIPWAALTVECQAIAEGQ